LGLLSQWRAGFGVADHCNSAADWPSIICKKFAPGPVTIRARHSSSTFTGAFFIKKFSSLAVATSTPGVFVWKTASCALLLTPKVQDNNTSGLFSVPLELILAAVASRSSLVGALLRNALPTHRHLILDFLQGLSRDELECLAEFQGACILELAFSENRNSYRLMTDFFDPAFCERWRNPDDRAHKMFIVLAYLDHLEQSFRIPLQPKSLKPA
jgi:hypothetical protein